jgi:hypothetical protein
MHFENLFKNEPSPANQSKENNEKTDIKTSELFGKPLTPEEEQDVSGGIPTTFQDGVKPADWKKKLQVLKGLTPKANPPKLKF